MRPCFLNFWHFHPYILYEKILHLFYWFLHCAQCLFLHMHEPPLSTPVHLRFFIVCMAYEMCNIFAQIEWPTTNTQFTQLRAGQRSFTQAVSCQNQGEHFCKFVVEEGRNCQFGQYLCVIVTVYFTHIL